MGRIAATFDALGRRNRAALIAFATAGDPDPDTTVPLMHALAGAGVDIIELGVPFSDPMAEGPVIQRASERALSAGVSLGGVLRMVASFRQDNDQTPVVLMGYLNPIAKMGYKAFAAAAGKAGVDGAITVDLPPEEGDEYYTVMREQHIDPVFMLAPTTTAQRINRVCAAASGFIYYVSLRGVTGATTMDMNEVRTRIADIKRSTGLPVGVGFGINNAATAGEVAKFADAVVVGSALVDKMFAQAGDRARVLRVAADFMRELKESMENARL